MYGMLIVKGTGFSVGIESEQSFLNNLFRSLNNLFPKRYIPEYTVSTSSGEEGIDALVSWISGESFSVQKHVLKDNGIDEYFIRSSLPEPYVNESPYFFLLQVIARSIVKNDYLVLTDSISFVVNNKTYLLIGYPHTGKSTLLALALMNDAIPLSTENTVVSVSRDGVRIVGGTSVLVYDPRIEDIYNVKLEYDSMTRHGYRIVDLEKHYPMRNNYYGEVVDAIYVLHSSFRSVGVDAEPVKGRKILKTLWYFASALLRGLDYYPPYPLVLSTRIIDDKVENMLRLVSEKYSGRFYEVYGRHDYIFKYIVD